MCNTNADRATETPLEEQQLLSLLCYNILLLSCSILLLSYIRLNTTNVIRSRLHRDFQGLMTPTFYYK